MQKIALRGCVAAFVGGLSVGRLPTHALIRATVLIPRLPRDEEALDFATKLLQVAIQARQSLQGQDLAALDQAIAALENACRAHFEGPES